MQRIYLDNAATSWPKPPVVYEAIDRYQREIGAAAGRGVYDSAMEASKIVSRARSAVATIIGARDPKRILFAASGTEALNQAIFGLLRPGAHVVTTVCEHNSVLRPLALMRDTQGVGVEYVGCDAAGHVDPQAIADAVRSETRLVAVTAASNVTGALQDVHAIGQMCAERKIPLLVDAAQSLGHAPIDVERDRISLLASPGHKGLLGPLGTGLLYLAPGLEEQVRPLIHGGTGLNSDQESPPAKLPERYEAGNLNVPALAGLAAGADWIASGENRSQSATNRLLTDLSERSGITVYGPPPGVARAPVVSLNVEGYDPQEVATVLASVGVECRAGLHCAPRIHHALGAAVPGGTVRFSPGHFTTDDQISRVVDVLRELATRG